jgi:hypothetical protein
MWVVNAKMSLGRVVYSATFGVINYAGAARHSENLWPTIC